MDNCGFKSVIFNKNSFAVKKQRVYGSYPKLELVELRFTPVYFEINYKVKILFKQINIVRSYSTLIKHDHLQVELIMDPWFVTGFTDGEGCFNVQIFKSTTKTGEAVKLSFIITQHIRDENLIRSLILYFGCGNIYKSRKEVYFKITKLSYLIPPPIKFYPFL